MEIISFEPAYAALAELLVNSASFNFTGDATEGDPVLRNVPDIGPLVTGIASVGPLVPPGTTVLSISGSDVTFTQPLTATQAATAVRAGFASTDPMQARLLRHWNDVPPPEQPALFLAQGAEDQQKRTGQPGLWTLDSMVWVYAYAPNETTPVAPLLNVLLGAIRGVFMRDASGPGRAQNRQTLGGLVFDTWINGRIETDEGFLGQQAVARIPIRMIQNGP